MKSSFIFLLLCSFFLIGALAQECSIDIPQCQLCDTNSTLICNECNKDYKPSEDK